MKLVFAPVMLALATAVISSTAQTSPPQAPATSPQHRDQTRGQVLFSRSMDENGNTTTTRGPGAPAVVATPIADDRERQAVTFTSYDMEVHLEPAAQHIAVRALLTVRNDGKAPLAHVPLQISSSLNWERIRIGAQDVSFKVATLNSDSDHTGQLHEAAVPLAAPLAPGATLQLDVTYSGAIAQNAQRLVVLGTPDDVALHVNWDEIGVDFTGLRGFGDVAWYPVSSVPVILGDGARLFDEIGEHKLHMEGARFHLRLTDEFPSGHAPTVALINGQSVPLAITNGSEEVAGVAKAELSDSILGFETPSLFVAVRKPVEGSDVTLWTRDEDEATASDWLSAVPAVAPFLESWLGAHPRSKFTILDLPDAEDVPTEMGAATAMPIREISSGQLDDVMVHGLTHAWLRTAMPPPAWLDEGLAYFMGTLWTEKQSGRTKALESLAAGRQALALAEPSSPGEGAGEPLRQAIAPAYYRTKAGYIFWMLRDIAGDAALSSALRAYDSARDGNRNGGPGEFENLLEQSSHRNLSWFFSDWVDADKGLPDLAIDSVFPAAAQNGNTLVAVNLSNSGYAAAEIPVIVRTAGTSITQRVFVPARGKAVRRILIQGAPAEVQANDGTVPETEASIHMTKLTTPGNGPAATDGSDGPQ